MTTSRVNGHFTGFIYTALNPDISD